MRGADQDFIAAIAFDVHAQDLGDIHYRFGEAFFSQPVCQFINVRSCIGWELFHQAGRYIPIPGYAYRQFILGHQICIDPI